MARPTRLRFPLVQPGVSRGRHGDVFIGTSGFSYPHWREVFYPKGLPSAKWLEFYTQRFTTVEINATFYRAPRTGMLERWYAETPAGFRFTLKASRVITHIRKLARCRTELATMWGQFAPLREKLTLVLFQLPPSLHANAERLERFLRWLPSTPRIALEFRHASWYEPEVFDVLRKHRRAVVIHDMPRRGDWKLEAGDWKRAVTTDFVYLRFHGNIGGRAWGEYGRAALRPWARLARPHLRAGRDVYAYFNNDAGGAAVRDAERFQKLITNS